MNKLLTVLSTIVLLVLGVLFIKLCIYVFTTILHFILTDTITALIYLLIGMVLLYTYFKLRDRYGR
jgi:hypothetical protein